MSLVFSFLYPITVFLVLKYFALSLNDAIYLKILPLLISSYITFLLILSYVKKNSMILKFAKRFSKKKISKEDIEYIKNSTLFWIALSCINIVLHVNFLLCDNEYYWVAYSSFGWYFVFAFGGVLQYIHRKFVFLKRQESV